MRIREAKDMQMGEYSVFSDVTVIQQEALPENINLRNVLNKLELSIPEHFVNELDAIYIGTYDFLLDRDLNALYDNGAIFISSVQDDEDDLFDDIVHEIAHCLEETYTQDIYGDKNIENEFIVKRKKLLDILRVRGYNVSLKDFLEPEYNVEFDKMLYIDIGYPTLLGLSSGLFVSPYGITSLREYFANAFEEMFARKNSLLVKKISPAIYTRIQNLM